MDAAEARAAIRLDGRILATAAATGLLDRPVPSCPGWDLARLVAHTGRVHRWVAAAVRADADPGRVPPMPEGADPATWFAEGVDELLDALGSVDPDQPCWTHWPGSHTFAFWHRRMAVETAIHRVDAEAAIGRTTPVSRAVSMAGIEEVFDALVPRAVERGVRPGSGQTLHLHATDGDGEWLLQLEPDRVEVHREHAKGDAAVRAAASDLLLWLWNRPPVGAVEVFGAAEVADGWRSSFRF